jgi:ankyrin repeat protein
MSSRLQRINLHDLNNLLKSGAHPNTTIDFLNPKALIYCCASGYFEVVKLFVENGADLNTVNIYGWWNCKTETALMEAAFNGHFKIVKFLVEKSADPNAINKHGNTALMMASKEANFEIVKFLVEIVLIQMQ